MNFNKPKAGGSKPAAVIRTRTVHIVKPSISPQSTAASQRPAARHNDPDRFRKALERPTSRNLASRKPPNVVARALVPSRGIKRKSATPQPINMFSDDEEEQSSDLAGSDSDASRKRIKSSISSVETNGPKRNIISDEAFKDNTTFDIIHGADSTSGAFANKFRPPWDHEDFECTELQYPTRGPREKFELKFPKHMKDDYKPMEDIIQTMDTISAYYFPEEARIAYLDDSEGSKRRYEKAWVRQSITMLKQTVEDFNMFVNKLVKDGTIEKELSRKPNMLDINWASRILEQVYSRTVSPKVESLKAYENGTDYVYGELLPRFCDTIFKQTNLDQEQVFLDLGSGVGNVVLQAALQTGCESWGIEIMENPSALAKLQVEEFTARTKLWGLSHGKVNLVQGDFTENSDIRDVLRRADVVLVNNQAFTAELNRRLCDMFLDLKDGCQIVSLRPFRPDDWKMRENNIHDFKNQLRQRRFEYFSASVSWADHGGYYYIATKDPKELLHFMKKRGLS